MAKPFGGKRPQDLRHTLRRFMDYLGRHKIMLGVVGLLAAVSALAALLGTYMIRPIVNGVLENGSAAYLAGVVALTAGIYIVGALSTLGYTQLMVRAAQKILQDIRRDLFAHLQTLPLHYFDTNRKGDLMSLFTNDVDTISDALNNSFAVVIQTFIQVAGTLLLLFILNWRLSLLVVVGYIAMFWYINYSTQRSRAFYARQQASLGELDAYMEEMIAGQKVVKVFNHQQADMAAFAARNEKLREAGTGAQSYAATMIPAVVSIGYLNYAVIAVVGGLMVMWVRPRQPGQLSGLCAPDDAAHQPADPAGQFPAGGAGGCGAYLHGHGGKAGDRRGHGGAGQRAGKQRRYADRVCREHGPLGLV